MVGYPIGGETISVTTGVVSRIEVTSYSHGATELLGIQIDAAINPGNSGASCPDAGRLSPSLQAAFSWTPLLIRRRCAAWQYTLLCLLELCQIWCIEQRKRQLLKQGGPAAGGPCFNEIGQCVGIAFQSLGHGEADGIGYVIPTPVINHFLTDYK